MNALNKLVPCQWEAFLDLVWCNALAYWPNSQAKKKMNCCEFGSRFFTKYPKVWDRKCDTYVVAFCLTTLLLYIKGPGPVFTTLPCSLLAYIINIINDDSSIVTKWSFKLSDDLRVIIYDRHMFIIQAM
jgi:hypothetical protein